MGLMSEVGGRRGLRGLGAGGLPFGACVTARSSFLDPGGGRLLRVVKPYTVARDKFFPPEAAGTPADVALLEEIRDLLAHAQGPV